MKAIIIMVFLYSAIWGNNFKDITLSQFADRVSMQNNINIFIDEDFKEKVISLYIPTAISNKELLKMFKSSISKLGFNLSRYGNTHYLTKKLLYKDKSYLYKLKYNSALDAQTLLKIMNVKYSYLQDTNTLAISCTSDKYKKIQSSLSQIDVIQKQVMLKIMIFEYSTNDIKERGIQYASIYKDLKGSVSYALNTIVAPLSTNNPTLSSIDFYGALRLLNEQKEVTVKQFPYVLSKNNKMFKFEAVENIPYLVKTVSTQATNTSEENSINYKDVGLKINGKSFIYDDYITLDIDLVIEDLINQTEETTMPQTYKRVLKSNTNIKYNQVLLLSGIKRLKHTKNDWNIPYISNIPYLGEIFKYSTKNDEEINITIAIEVLNEDSNISNDIYFQEVHEVLAEEEYIDLDE